MLPTQVRSLSLLLVVACVPPLVNLVSVLLNCAILHRLALFSFLPPSPYLFTIRVSISQLLSYQLNGALVIVSQQIQVFRQTLVPLIIAFREVSHCR